MTRAGVKLLVCLMLQLALSSCNRKVATPAASEPRPLAEYVAAGACFTVFDSEKNFEEMENRLAALSRDKSQASDHALTMLTGYYLGEHNGEELFGEIIRRGKRMKPMLVEQQLRPRQLNTCASSLERDTMKALISDMLDRIDKEEHWD